MSLPNTLNTMILPFAFSHVIKKKRCQHLFHNLIHCTHFHSLHEQKAFSSVKHGLQRRWSGIIILRGTKNTVRSMQI